MNMLTTEKLTMSSKEISELLESRHDNVKTAIERLSHKGIITFTAMQEKPTGGRPAVSYHVNERDSYVVVAQLSPEFTARIVDRWQELEKKQPALPDFNNPVEAARAWADRVEAEQLAISQRDAAIATKAEIGQRREATAMNTASQAVKKANKLEIELDKSKEYCTIKRMEMLCHGQKFKWRELKSTSIELELPPIDVFDANYGTVKAYHKAAWLETYGLEF